MNSFEQLCQDSYETDVLLTTAMLEMGGNFEPHFAEACNDLLNDIISEFNFRISPKKFVEKITTSEVMDNFLQSLIIEDQSSDIINAIVRLLSERSSNRALDNFYSSEETSNSAKKDVDISARQSIPSVDFFEITQEFNSSEVIIRALAIEVSKRCLKVINE